jgi:hypothetical protein
MKAFHHIRILAKGREGHFSTADERQAAGAGHIIRRVVSLKSFYGFRSASAWSRQEGKRDALKGAEASGSVRVEATLFMELMEDFHSFFVVGGAVSHFGQRSSSWTSLASCKAGTPSWHRWAHWSLAKEFAARRNPDKRLGRRPNSAELRDSRIRKRPWKTQRPPVVPFQRKPQATDA